jgi:hypothetical protein
VKETISKVVFMANLAYYDKCRELKGTLDPKNVDLDAYCYFELDEVPDTFDFSKPNNRVASPLFRKRELQKALCFVKPPGMSDYETRQAESSALEAVCECLKAYGIISHVRWSYH